MSRLENSDFIKLWDAAWAQGCEAAANCQVTAMTVRDGTGNRWHVPEGPCGFAWINIKPGTSSFAKWLVKTGHCRKDSYYGGVTAWIGLYGQSVDRKYAHAQAMAKSLTAAGIKCYAMSRLD